MLWPQMWFLASALLSHEQPPSGLERLLAVLTDRGFSRGPLLVMDSAAAPELLTSLLRVLQLPVLLLHPPVPKSVTAAKVAEPVTGFIFILRDEANASATLRNFLDISQKWVLNWTPYIRCLVIFVSTNRRQRASEYSLLQALDERNMLDASVLVLVGHPRQETTTEAALYVWFRNGSCTVASGHPTVIGQWNLTDDRLINFPTVLFPKKLPNIVEGCPLTVLVYPYPPLAMAQKDEDGREYFVGLEVSMLQLVAQTHSFQLRMVNGGARRNIYGRRLANGSWTGVAVELTSGRADLALGGLPLIVATSRPLEHAISYINQRLVWFTPRPETLPGWRSMFSGNPAEITSILFALNIVISVIIWAASSLRGVREYNVYNDSCIAMFAVTLSVPVREPSTASGRVAFLSWIIFSMIIQTTMTSLITSHLAHPYVSRPITTEEELLQSGLPGASLRTIAEDIYPAFQKRGAPNITVICNSYDDCARRVAYDRDVAVLAPEIGFMYIGRTKFHDEFGAALFTSLTDTVASSHSAMVLAKGNPLTPLISDMIMHIAESGLVRYDDRSSAAGVGADADNNKAVFSFYFVIYLISMVSWFAVLLGEIAFNKWSRWRKR